MKKPSGFKMRSGNKPSFAKLSGANRSPMRQEPSSDNFLEGLTKEKISQMTVKELQELSKKEMKRLENMAINEIKKDGDDPNELDPKRLQEIIVSYQSRSKVLKAIMDESRKRKRAGTL